MTLTLPPFRGVVRRLILAVVLVFFALLVISRTPLYPTLIGWLALWPATVWRGPWQLVTNAFLPTTLMGTLFALLSVWTFGTQLETERGGRWMVEYFVASVAGGSAITALLAWTPLLAAQRGSYAAGLWPFAIALLLAYARFHPEQEVMLLVLRLKVKYMVAIYLLVYFALSLGDGDRLGAVMVVAASLAGFVFLQTVGRLGLTFAASERWYGLRNGFYRWKRKQAAKKFEVYMREQGKDVRVQDEDKWTH